MMVILTFTWLVIMMNLYMIGSLSDKIHLTFHTILRESSLWMTQPMMEGFGLDQGKVRVAKVFAGDLDNDEIGDLVFSSASFAADKPHIFSSNIAEY